MYASEREINMSFGAWFNPFMNQDVYVSKAFHQTLQDLSRKGSGDGEGSGVSGAPFKRMVDGWLLAVAIGASMDIAAPEISEVESVKVIAGSVLQKDIGAIEFLMSLAIAETGDPYVVDDPRKMMKIAQGFAELGFPRLIEMAKQGHLGATENLARALVQDLSE